MSQYDVPPYLKGRYRLTEQVGAGGMATVYRAHDEMLERDIAIKFLSPQLFLDTDREGEASARFLREARAVARLAHPNIVTLFDAGQEGVWHYLVLEYVAGHDLKSASARHGGRMPLDEALRLVTGTLQGLDYAHALGIIHRDIKPRNLLITPAGEVKIADFGLALIQNDVRLTREGLILGTPLYMSPEMLAEGRVDFRADLYALGVVFYELLTGKPPYSGSSPTEVISQILHARIPSPRDENPYLPSSIEVIILKLLAKNPDERFPSARAVLDALYPPQAAPVSAADRELAQELLLYTAQEDAVAAVEAERRRLARRFESDIVEALNMMLAQASMYEQSLMGNPQARMAASVMASLARQALAKARELSANLNPTVLESLGLEPALESLADTMLRSRGVQADVRLERLRERLPTPLELTLFRAAQDAVERAITHARASLVRIILERRGDQITLTIADNGLDTGGLELMENARRRLKQMGCSTETHSLAEGGLEFIITFKIETPVKMTPREIEVLQLLAEGMSNKAIARALSLSPRTVNFHLDNIYAKLGVNSRTEAAIYALRRGWTKRPR
jgi:signal transduction histidine kinase/DNA-binding CsgD family transcriptional regulator